MTNNEITFFAETNYRNERRLFGIKRDDRRRHTYVIGKTGMGKSVLLTQMIYSDIEAGDGLCVVDPHGELVESILDFVPPHRINDVIFFNPGDTHFPIAFNILEAPNPETRHLVASGLVGVFKKIWADSWGPRLEYVLRNAILALLDYPGSTLLGVLRILTDKTYRKRVLEKVEDPVVRGFWIDEYAKYPDKFQAEAIAPIQNKVGQFLSNSLIRNVVGQVKSAIDIRDVMDNKKILLLNLSKGRIGEDTSSLLGAMMITQIQLAAMSRIDTEEAERNDFYLYVDEFQNFATESFAGILSEARKYRLNLTIAHQYIEQLSDEVKAAVFGNVGTIICFRVGATDAEELVKEFAPYFTEEDLVNLAKWQIYLKLMIDGVASTPFSANTLPPVYVKYDSREKIIKVTRERYSKPREVIQDKISRWASGLEQQAVDDHKAQSAQPPKSARALANARANNSLASPGGASGAPAKPASTKTAPPKPEVKPKKRETSPDTRVWRAPTPDARQESVLTQPRTEARPKPGYGDAPQKPQRNVKLVKEVSKKPADEAKKLPTVSPAEKVTESKGDDPYKFEAICSRCGNGTKVSFEPDPSRPVYCKDCLRVVRSETADKKSSQEKKPESSKKTVPPKQQKKKSTKPEASAEPQKESIAGTTVAPGQRIVLS